MNEKPAGLTAYEEDFLKSLRDIRLKVRDAEKEILTNSPAVQQLESALQEARDKEEALVEKKEAVKAKREEFNESVRNPSFFDKLFNKRSIKELSDEREKFADELRAVSKEHAAVYAGRLDMDKALPAVREQALAENATPEYRALLNQRNELIMSFGVDELETLASKDWQLLNKYGRYLNDISEEKDPVAGANEHITLSSTLTDFQRSLPHSTRMHDREKHIPYFEALVDAISDDIESIERSIKSREGATGNKYEADLPKLEKDLETESIKLGFSHARLQQKHEDLVEARELRDRDEELRPVREERKARLEQEREEKEGKNPAGTAPEKQDFGRMIAEHKPKEEIADAPKAPRPELASKHPEAGLARAS